MAHRLAPEAEADLDELWYYVASNSSVETADRLVDSITARLFKRYENHIRTGGRASRRARYGSA